jgi:hypothetical protein
MNQNQKGFSVVEVLLVGVVLAIVGFAGWWAWRAHHKDDTGGKNPATAQQTPQTQTVTYLTLSDYKVRIPLGSTTEKLTLGPVTPLSNTDSSVSVIAPQLDNGWKCVADSAGYKGTIGKISITTQTRRSGPSAPVISKKIGNYTYGFEPGAANCTDSAQYQQLIDAFKVQFAQMATY